jgi:hypothetical protein
MRKKKKLNYDGVFAEGFISCFGMVLTRQTFMQRVDAAPHKTYQAATKLCSRGGDVAGCR